MDLELKHLLLVQQIAEAGSMTAAAERLNLTQSALSHQLRGIETCFDTPFFSRVGRPHLRNAPAGRGGQTPERRVADVARAEEDLRRIAGHGDGVIRVCTQCNTGYHWLGPLLKVFARKHPRVSIHVAVDATDSPIAAVVDGRVDLAILSGETTDRRVRTRPLFRDEMVAVVPSAHPLAARRWVRPLDLAAEHLLIYASRPEESFVLTQVLAPAGVRADRVSFLMLTEAIVELARAGVGVGVLPRWSIERALASGGLVALSITRRGMHRQWTAATLAAQSDPAYLTDFVALIIERAAPARSERRSA
jgi:LysR family transcriptional regulator, regulator for metE and metH